MPEALPATSLSENWNETELIPCKLLRAAEWVTSLAQVQPCDWELWNQELKQLDPQVAGSSSPPKKKNVWQL